MSLRIIHVSWHITAIAAGVLVGTALSLLIPYGLFTGLGWLLLAVALSSFIAIKKTTPTLVLAILGGVFLGLWNSSRVQVQLAAYDDYHGHHVELRGKVVGDAVRGSSGDLQLGLGEISINDQYFYGQVWASVPTDLEIKRGDKVAIEGQLNEGFGTNSATMFRADIVDIERPEPGDVARRVRDNFSEKVSAAIPGEEGGLGISFLVGQRNVLPEEINNEFRILGLVHIVVASGFQLTIVVRFSKSIFQKYSRYLATLTGFVMIGCFIMLTGFSTSMVRAGIVAGLSLLAWHYGRVVHPVKLLLIVAGATVLINPIYLWSDIGWYLSFAAFAGVIVIAPLIHSYFWGPDNKPGLLRELIVATSAAQLATLPIVVASFGEYSPLALLANLLILPFIAYAMLLTLFAGIAAYIVPALSLIFGFPAHLLLSYMTALATWMSSLPWAKGEMTMSPQIVAASYMIMLGATVYIWRRSKHNFCEKNFL